MADTKIIVEIPKLLHNDTPITAYNAVFGSFNKLIFPNPNI